MNLYDAIRSGVVANAIENLFEDAPSFFIGKRIWNQEEYFLAKSIGSDNEKMEERILGVYTLRDVQMLARLISSFQKWVPSKKNFNELIALTEYVAGGLLEVLEEMERGVEMVGDEANMTFIRIRQYVMSVFFFTEKSKENKERDENGTSLEQLWNETQSFTLMILKYKEGEMMKSNLLTMTQFIQSSIKFIRALVRILQRCWLWMSLQTNWEWNMVVQESLHIANGEKTPSIMWIKGLKDLQVFNSPTRSLFFIFEYYSKTDPTQIAGFFPVSFAVDPANGRYGMLKEAQMRVFPLLQEMTARRLLAFAMIDHRQLGNHQIREIPANIKEMIADYAMDRKGIIDS